ncbi:hypothetical protein [Halococcus saccharolyticus]|uniref:Uncharacterized protein n=1 Tax=Halococcus saccharolyticus DSM 5350 TaxID=1227455 RepID=M0MET9_9EURY|nr:hypothetical protein [Halococcus saccharolyticus]EMA44267.1 hypothetical protein C449_12093 [Halococcus saccharolyticus DSM 5350]
MSTGERWTITYRVDVGGTPYAGSVTVSNMGMSDDAARQYAANHLLDTTLLVDATAAGFDAGDIEVQYRRVAGGREQAVACDECGGPVEHADHALARCEACFGHAQLEGRR